jgi:Mor family transcriptional regulator
MYSKELRDKICNEYVENNVLLKDLQKTYKVNRNTIRKILEERGIHNKRDKRKYINDKEVIKMYSTGMNCDEIAKNFKCSRHPIVNILKEYNLMRKSGPVIGKYKGSKNPNWKGGISKYESYTKEINNFKYKLKIWSAKVIERDEIKCVMCESNEKLESHHITPVRHILNKEDLFDTNNGITLCRKCHLSIHFKEKEYEDTFRRMIANRVKRGNS